jgi:hypothetical protein
MPGWRETYGTSVTGSLESIFSLLHSIQESREATARREEPIDSVDDLLVELFALPAFTKPINYGAIPDGIATELGEKDRQVFGDAGTTGAFWGMLRRLGAPDTPDTPATD